LSDSCTTALTARIIATAWPFADLRRLLAAQPLLAVPAGHPIALRRALTAKAELRPYLFYKASGGLDPIWPDHRA